MHFASNEGSDVESSCKVTENSGVHILFTMLATEREKRKEKKKESKGKENNNHTSHMQPERLLTFVKEKRSTSALRGCQPSANLHLHQLRKFKRTCTHQHVTQCHTTIVPCACVTRMCACAFGTQCLAGDSAAHLSKGGCRPHRQMHLLAQLF
jgi:hypothetical protein